MSSLTDLLLKLNVIHEKQAEAALAYAKENNMSVKNALLDKRLITEKELAEAYAAKSGFPFIDIDEIEIQKEAVLKLSPKVAEKNIALSFRFEGTKLSVAFADPFLPYAQDNAALNSKMEIVPYVAEESLIKQALKKFHINYNAENIVYGYSNEKKNFQLKEEKPYYKVEASKTVQLVETILEKAVINNASDIHIEPFESHIRIRYRIDGKLIEMFKTEIEGFSEIIARIKVMGGMDSASHHFPQDGHCRRTIAGVDLDLRINVILTIFGEKAVIRLIYRIGQGFDKNNLGFLPKDVEKIDKLLKNNNGIILVTGPTGSGKTTTLYSCLRELSKPDVNIITVEDPVENILEGITQINVNPKASLTFSGLLKFILRQDPDVIMIGEIRDTETAAIAIRSALTGHLVLSTLHTHDAVSTIIRLLDMGIEDYLLANALKGVISQRLVRKICSRCKESYIISEKDAQQLSIPIGTRIFKGLGCHHCNYTGYKGRFAIYEIMMLRESVVRDILKFSQRDVLPKENSIYHNAIKNVLSGNTTLDEVYAAVYSYY